MKLLSCFLYVPVAQLSSVTFSEIERTLATKSVALHYRQIEIRNLSLIAGKEEYNSENLFTSDVPCRIVVCFVPSKNKTGSYSANPFDFQRSWTVNVDAPADESRRTEREKYLEQKLLDFEKQLSFFKSCVTLVHTDETANASKGKGRGKRTPATTSQQSSIFDRLRGSFSGPSDENNTELDEAASLVSQTSTPPPAYSSSTENVGATKTVYIKNVDLFLNGAPVDQEPML